jgi:hypothetical protein
MTLVEYVLAAVINSSVIKGMEQISGSVSTYESYVDSVESLT